MKTINPSTGEHGSEITYESLPKLQRELQNIRKNQHRFGNTKLKDRLVHIARIGTLLEKRKKLFAKMMAKEVGKPITIGLQEIDKCIALCDYCVHYSEEALKNEKGKTHGGEALISYEPLGVILNIAPWNYPFWLALRSAIPAICAGNGVMVKHSSYVPECTKAINKLFKDSGLRNIAICVQTKSDIVSQLIEKKVFDGVSVIGGSETGSIVASNAALHLIPQVLELGGSDPFIVFDDADLRKAAQQVIASRMFNTGQNCDSAKRLFVQKRVASEFEQMLIDEVSKLTIGDPMNELTAIGPMISSRACEDMASIVEDARRKGARLIYGGHKLNRKGSYFMPTILADVTMDMKVMSDEVFGPILPISTFSTESEVIEMANNTKYGLGASVWTKDKKRINKIVREIKAGVVCVNKKVRSDILLPFGGIKGSGYGRELGILGFRSFVNVKSISFG